MPHYLGAFFPALTHNPGRHHRRRSSSIALLAALNIRGLGESAKLNLVLAVADLCTQVLLVVLGVVLVLNPSLLSTRSTSASAPSWTQLIFALSIAMVAYTGIETVSNMAEEAKDPGRDVPKAVNLVLIAVLGVYAGHLGRRALGAAGRRTTRAATPTTLARRHAHGGISRTTRCSGSSRASACTARCSRSPAYYVGVLAATILFIATNAGLIGISRLSWSLAEHRQLPGDLLAPAPALPHAVVHDRRSSRCSPALLILPGNTDLLGNLYSFGAMLSFTTAHVAVIALRVKEPDRERPYRMPVERPHPRRDDPADRGDRRDRHVRRLGRRSSRCTPRRARRHPAGWSSGWPATSVYRRRQGLDLREPPQDRARASARPTSRSSTTARRSCRSSAATSAPRRCAAPPS